MEAWNNDCKPTVVRAILRGVAAWFRGSKGGRRVPIAVGLTSVAVIAFQLVIMQTMSIAQWHHFAYMVISMAMLGFGAAGTVLAIFRAFFLRHYRNLLPCLFLAAGLTMAAAAWMSGWLGDFNAFLLFHEGRQIGLLAFTYLVYCLPFFFAGLAITLVFYREVERIGPLYFANMVGSGIGALLAIGLFWIAEPAALSGVLSLLVFVSAWLTRPTGSRFVLAWWAALTVALISIFNPSTPEPSEYKDIRYSLQLPGARRVHRSSSPYGTLEVVAGPAQRYSPGLSLRHPGEPPIRKIIYNNGNYFGTLLGSGRTEDDKHILDYTTRALPYAFRRPERVLVLNASTGADVSQAVARGTSVVAAVEPNRHAVHLLARDYPDWIDSLYLNPRVQLHTTTARSFLSRQTDEQYDLVVLPVLGAFGGTAGVEAMQEQYHLTEQAFGRMWERLDRQGMIAATVWLESPPRISLKLLATWRKILDDRLIDRTEDHLIAVRSWGAATFVLSKSPVSRTERQRIRDFAASLNFDPLLLADLRPGERERYNQLQDQDYFAYIDTLVSGPAEQFVRRYPFNLSPATDNRPFFHQFLELRTIRRLCDLYGCGQIPYLEIGSVLAAATLIQIVLFSTVLIVLPLASLGWRGGGRRWTFLYFAGTGVGFMFFEIALIQQLILYLGLPVYAAALGLASLLIYSGLGSYFSGVLASDRVAARRIAHFIAGLILVCALFLMPLFGWTMGWPLAIRIIIVLMLMGPPAFCMGMMFPFGLRQLSGASQSHIPWAAGIDSCLSVSATAVATLLALRTGFTVVMVIAAAAYLLVALASSRIGGAK